MQNGMKMQYRCSLCFGCVRFSGVCAQKKQCTPLVANARAK